MNQSEQVIVIDPKKNPGPTPQQNIIEAGVQSLLPVAPQPQITDSSSHEEKGRLLRRLTNLLHGLPGAVVMLDGDGRVQQCNPAAKDLLGEPLSRELWRDVVRRAFSPRWDDGHDMSLVSGRIVNISTQPMIDEPGQILLIKDVTETRQLQEQLNRAKRLSAKGEMAAALAHQIRTPLASAILYLSNLSNKQLDDTARQKFTAKSLARLNYLEKLIEDMLLFARGGNFETREISLLQLINDLKQQIKPQLDQNQFRFIVDPGITDSQIRVNPEAMISVMHNLVDNAIEACGKGGVLFLSTQTDGQMVRISLTDNGSGIPAAIQETLFEPFVTTRATGTGLGLSVVQSVIRSHGGVITVEDVEPHGTRFEIILPVVNDKKSGVELI